MGEHKTPRPYNALTGQTLVKRAGKQLDDLAGIHDRDQYISAVGDIHELLNETGRYIRRLQRQKRTMDEERQRAITYHNHAVQRMKKVEDTLISLWENGTEITPAWKEIIGSFDTARAKVETAHTTLMGMLNTLENVPGARDDVARLEEALQEAWEAMPRCKRWFRAYEPSDPGSEKTYTLVLGVVTGEGLEDGYAYDCEQREEIYERINALSNSTQNSSRGSK